MGGGASSVRFTLKSTPANLSFDGTARAGANGYLDGRGSFSAPSTPKLFDWWGAPLARASAIGAITLESQVSGSLQRLRFENATLTLDGKPARGALDLILTGKLPMISGTLAFDTLDIGSFLAAFTPRQDPASTATNGAETKVAPAFDLSVIDQFALDLRLSAARATGGPMALSGVAATAQVRPGLAAFDISDARAFGGNVQAGFRVDRKPTGDVGEMRLSATDIDWMLLAESSGWRRNPPRSRGSFSVILKGPVADWASMPSAVTGTIAARFGPGSIDGVDFDKFLKRVVQGGFFPLTEVSPGTLPFEGAEIKATVLGGAARVDAAIGWHQDVEVSLGGIVPFLGRGLALSGVVRSRDGVEPARDPRHFFVGGSWSVPYISPMLPVFSPE
jgi:AsmA protein